MPATSVIALCAPGVPSNGIPKSRALGLVWAKAAVKDKKINSSELIINAGTEFPRRGELFFRVMSSVLFIEGAPYSLVRCFLTEPERDSLPDVFIPHFGSFSDVIGQHSYALLRLQINNLDPVSSQPLNASGKILRLSHDHHADLELT